MKYILVIISFTVTSGIMSCSNNNERLGKNNAKNATDSASTLDISRKSGNNSGISDSSLKSAADSTANKADTVK